MTAQDPPIMVNAYGNCESPPDGWVRLNVHANTAWVKCARELGLAVQALMGWTGRRFARPILVWYVHPEAESRAMVSPNKVTRSVRANRFSWRRDVLDKLTPELRGIAPTKRERAFELLFRNLDDINAAHPTWLREAQRAVKASLTRRGIMSSWVRGYTDSDFYECVCRSIGAYRRHELTHYDEIDKTLMSDTEISALRAELSA